MLLEMLTEQLGGNTVNDISKQLGVSQQQASGALASALPMLVGALAKNSASSDGASSLNRALEKDHDGSILDNLSGFLGNAAAGPGDGILKHVLGDRRSSVESALGKTSGLGSQQMGSLLTMLAPIVMGALGKTQREQGLDASGLSDLLAGERKRVAKDNSAMGMLSLLDADGDGSVIDDVAGLMGKFFK